MSYPFFYINPHAHEQTQAQAQAQGPAPKGEAKKLADFNERGRREVGLQEARLRSGKKQAFI